MLYKLEKIEKRYGNRTILNIDYLALEKGKVYALAGANGAGKTTLLHVLAFLNEPTCGMVSYDGITVDWKKKFLYNLRREVVLLDQYPILFSGPVWKSVGFGLKVRGVPVSERKRKIEEALAMVGMEKFYNADGRRLSGGETKRVAMARALIIEPQVLLCDEPTANVDSENLEIILQILQKYNREKQATIVFATHLHDQGERLADETVVLADGAVSSAQRKNIFQGTCVMSANGKSQWRIGPEMILSAGIDGAGPGTKKSVYLGARRIAISVANQVKHDSVEENIWYGRVKKTEKTETGVAVTVDTSIDLLLDISFQEYQDKDIRLDTILKLRLNCRAEEVFVPE